MLKGTKVIPYLRTENLKKHTLSRGTYLYSPYMGVPPRREKYKGNNMSLQETTQRLVSFCVGNFEAFDERYLSFDKVEFFGGLEEGVLAMFSTVFS